MKTMTVEIPDNLDEHKAKMLLAVKLYENGSLTLGQAADIVNCSKCLFMEQLADYGVSLFNYTEAELEKDILNAQNHHF